MDEKNRQILEILQQDGRIAHTRLASIVDLSAPAVLARVRKLEEQGIIKGYQAVVDPAKVGHAITCYVSVSVVHHQREPQKQIAERLLNLPQVLEAYHLTGDIDYMLKVTVPNIEALEQFLMEDLASIPGLDKVHTSVVLSTVKANGVIPVVDEDELENSSQNGHR
ncbi:MAG: Lrp/AsnC family transcriptional regulator [Chloroflexi bacterium]|nr:Lrp/AsnC family transcriptional regulator [Chloroflexota bacterium]